MVAIKVSNPPEVDGVLDEDIWEKAVFVSDFIQKEPFEGQVPSESTEVAIAYDDEALYVGARMFSENPAELRGLISRRDQHGETEQFAISLDTYHDRRTGYGFGVTVSGVRFDRYYPQDFEHNKDYTFDPVWHARTSIDNRGWYAEMKIPFSQLRFTNREEHVWGINLNRWIPLKNEDIYWIIVPKDSTGWASRFGTLNGIRGIEPSSRIEVLPYFALEERSFDTQEDPLKTRTEHTYRVGGDLKIGLGSNLTLDATINPDFGQVEADPAVVNLSAYEVSFEEKRPFFIEGSQLLSGTGYFYSRRIGAPPHGPAPGISVGDTPLNSTILGAAKISGRLRNGLSTASLVAFTEREYARGYNYTLGQPTGEKIEVEPFTIYGATAFQQEFGEDNSTIKLLLTGVHRDIDENDPLSAILRKKAFTGYGDLNWRFRGGDYNLFTVLGFSYIEGDSAVIRKTQESSVHYFQRPDAGHVELKPDRTTLAGYNYFLELNKNSGKHWLWSHSLSLESPGLDLNDIGLLRAADDIELYNSVTYRENTPGDVFYRYSITGSVNNGWNFGGVRQFSNININPNLTFRNYWNFDMDIGVQLRAISDDLTRGGPLMGTPFGGWFEFGIENSHSEATKYGLEYEYFGDEFGGYSHNTGFSLSSRVGDKVQVSILPEFYYAKLSRQYVTTIEDESASTYGKRYVFSWLERSELSAQIRFNMFITPDMSFEFYAEPFASAGRYYRFGELREPKSRDLLEYGTEGTSIEHNFYGPYYVYDYNSGSSFEVPDRDFGYLSFRSNFVIRWEFLPGSTAYLVWQHILEDENDPGKMVRGESLLESLTSEGNSILAVKISYWIPVT
ncbi:MAG: hypothetical protein GF307_13910 [candidate division Zixibacteria bacterium]|nr:hypothetical protein [candidate division Zixibacteria bacterium]